MKDRDRRKLYGILALLGSIAVAIGTALTITYAALGVLIVYIKNNFAEWNETRKAAVEANKEKGKEKGPGLIQKLKNKSKKEKADKAVAKKNAEVKKTVATSAGIQVKPLEIKSTPQSYYNKEEPVKVSEPLGQQRPVVPQTPVTQQRPVVPQTPVTQQKPAVPQQPIVVAQTVAEQNIINEPQIIITDETQKIAKQPQKQAYNHMELNADDDNEQSYRTPSRFKGIKF